MWETERDLLAEMDTWEPLPDQIDPRWDSLEDDGDRLWADSERLIAAADLSGERYWREAAIRVFLHASDWDLNGALLDLRHGPEKAFGSAPRDVAEFAARLEPLTTSSRAGTRLWVARELGILRQLSSLPFLLPLLKDPHPGVALEARGSVAMMAERHPSARG
jgi:hypothetical protein